MMITYSLIPVAFGEIEANSAEIEPAVNSESGYRPETSQIRSRASRITWSGVIVLDYDYTVPEGVTLNIGAGSKIYSKKDVNIFIEGSIIVNGQKEAPVSFNSLEQNYMWNGIQFNESSDSIASHMSYCSISDAASALTFKGGNFKMHNITFGNNHIGLNLNLAKGELSNSKFISNDVALITDSADVTIINSTIDNSASFDVIMRNGSSVTFIGTAFDPSRIAADDIHSLLEVFWYLKVSIIDPRFPNSYSTGLSVIDAFGTKVHSLIIGPSDSSNWVKCKSFEFFVKPDEPSKIDAKYFTSHLIKVVRFGIIRTEIVYLDSFTHLDIEWSDIDSSISKLTALVSPDNQNSFLKDLQNLGWKHTIRPEKLNTLNYLAQRMKNLGRFNIDYDNHTHQNYLLDNGSIVDLHLANLVCTLPGSGAGSDKFLVISAHYDTDHNQDVVGADDDGSGVSALLEIARIIGYLEFNITIKFVFFDAEEEGYIGSYDYVKGASSAGNDIIADINLDMIGYNKDSGFPCIIRTNSDSLGIAQLFSDLNTGHSMGLDVTVVNDASYRRSDYFNFWDFGYRAVDFVEAEEIETWNLYYHTSLDTHDKINFSYLSKMTGLALAGLIDLTEIINSPPAVPGELAPTRSHLRLPTITWRPSMDINGGMLTYTLEVFETGPDLPGGPQKIIDLTLADNYYTFTTELRFGKTYSIYLTAWDDELASSGTYKADLFIFNTPPVLVKISSQNLTQGKSWELLVTAADADEPQDSLEYYINTSMFTINRTTGLINWTPTKHDVGMHTINISVLDGNGGMDYQWVFIEVANVNDAPEIKYSPPSLILDEDTTLFNALNLNDIFYDFDGDILEYKVVAPENINLTLHENGSVDISGRPNWFGNEFIKFTATDPFGLFFSIIIEVMILSVNDPPILLHIDDIIIFENDTIVLDPAIKDVDSTHIEKRSSWSNFTGTWYADFFSAGNYEMNLSVTDGEAEDWQWFNITVINVNRLPIKKFLSLLVGPITVGDKINLRADFIDPDDDINGNGFIDINESNNLTYTWNLGDGSYQTGDEIRHSYKKSGNYRIVLTVTDGDNDTVEFSIEFGVEEKSSTSKLTMILLSLIAVGLIIFSSILFYSRLKRRKAHEIEVKEIEDTPSNLSSKNTKRSVKKTTVKRVKKTVRNKSPLEVTGEISVGDSE
jgi:hypothetical protein